MSALCWFTIKTYCTVLWVEAWLCRELTNRKNWGWSRSSWFGGHSVYAVCMWCVCVCNVSFYVLYLWHKSLFICVHQLVSSCLGSSLMLLWSLAVFPLQLDSHSSVLSFHPLTHTYVMKVRWLCVECVAGSGWLQRRVKKKKKKKLLQF